MDLDQLVLSGALFNNSRSSSPARSSSPTKWPGSDYDSDSSELRKQGKDAPSTSEVPTQSIGMGPGRTGVKGVIRDRNEALAQERAQKAEELRELNRRLARFDFGAKTYAEEEREKLTLEDLLPQTRHGRFGHLREIGAKAFVNAVEEKDTYVVVHIHDPSLERCASLDATLARIARSNPETKFLRMRATAIGFASLGRKQPASYSKEEEEFADTEYEDYEDEEGEEDDDVDLDMLPTLLVYHAGELLHTWVRVDWEVGKEGIESLLQRHNILECGRLLDEAEDSDIE